MIKALLVDDEINNLENLAFLLTQDCEGVEVAGKAQNAAAAREWLSQHHADVVFLDINMPGENGFEWLQSLGPTDLLVIFVTAYDEYALQAIKASALDYIVKPVSFIELRAAVEKVKRTLSHPATAGQQRQLLEYFIGNIGKSALPKKIALPQMGGISFISVADIVSLQADSNYTIIHLCNMQKMVVTKTLKDFEELLDADCFVRVHKSYVVNLAYIKEYSTSDGGIVKMTDGNQWSVSRRQLDNFLEKMRSSSLVFGK